MIDRLIDHVDFRLSVYLRHWMKWFLAPVALALLDSDRLRRRLDFDTVKVQLEATYLLQTFASPNEYSFALKLSVASYLKIFIITFFSGVFDNVTIINNVIVENNCLM